MLGPSLHAVAPSPRPFRRGHWPTACRASVIVLPTLHFYGRFPRVTASPKKVAGFATCAYRFYMIFGRTDLRKAVSGAKFDAESDFEVRLAVAPPKSIKNDEKPTSETKKKID